MTHEQDFLRELKQIPPLPGHIYDSVNRIVKHRTFVKKTILSLAAGFITAVGITGVLISARPADPMLSADVKSELQSVSDFCNGNDLGSEIETYALYESDDSN